LSTVQRLLRVLLFGTVAVGIILPASAALAEPSPQELEQQLEKAHNELEDVVEDYNRIGEELKLTQAAAAGIAERLAPLQGQLDGARVGVAKIASVAYKNGGGLATAGALLTAGSTHSVTNQMQSIERVARARQREIAAFTETRDRYEAERKRLDALLRDQGEKQKQLTARKVTIEAEVKRLEELERRLESRGGRPSGSSTGSPPPPPPAGSGRGAVAVRYAYAQLGKMYQFGAAGPNTFDCSGLTQMAWRAAGVGLPHNAAMQYRATAKVGAGSIIPGDLVYSRSFGHVGIYIGNGKIIHSSRTGRPIAVGPLPSGAVYSRPG